MSQQMFVAGRMQNGILIPSVYHNVNQKLAPAPVLQFQWTREQLDYFTRLREIADIQSYALSSPWVDYVIRELKRFYPQPLPRVIVECHVAVILELMVNFILDCDNNPEMWYTDSWSWFLEHAINRYQYGKKEEPEIIQAEFDKVYNYLGAPCGLVIEDRSLDVFKFKEKTWHRGERAEYSTICDHVTKDPALFAYDKFFAGDKQRYSWSDERFYHDNLKDIYLRSLDSKGNFRGDYADDHGCTTLYLIRPDTNVYAYQDYLDRKRTFDASNLTPMMRERIFLEDKWLFNDQIWENIDYHLCDYEDIDEYPSEFFDEKMAKIIFIAGMHYFIEKNSQGIENVFCDDMTSYMSCFHSVRHGGKPLLLSINSLGHEDGCFPTIYEPEEFEYVGKRQHCSICKIRLPCCSYLAFPDGSGSIMCNWCAEKHLPFTTRDRFEFSYDLNKCNGCASRICLHNKDIRKNKTVFRAKPKVTRLPPGHKSPFENLNMPVVTDRDDVQYI